MGQFSSQKNTYSTMAELGLKKKEVDAIEFAFDVYDFKGDGSVDAFYAGDLIRACNLNPTLKTIAEVGGQTEKVKKILTKADVFPMYKACKDSKDQGGFHDLLRFLSFMTKMTTTPSLKMNCSNFLLISVRNLPRKKLRVL